MVKKVEHIEYVCELCGNRFSSEFAGKEEAKEKAEKCEKRDEKRFKFDVGDEVKVIVMDDKPGEIVGRKMASIALGVTEGPSLNKKRPAYEVKLDSGKELPRLFESMLEKA